MKETFHNHNSVCDVYIHTNTHYILGCPENNFTVMNYESTNQQMVGNYLE